jgi:hypothetical protein
MAKYLVKEDYEVQWVRPSNGTTALAVFKKGTVIEAGISQVDGSLVTRVDGTMPSFADGEVLVKVNEQKVELVPDKAAEEAAKKQAMMKWVYLGGTAVLLWWFVYGRNNKKKYSESSPGFAGVNGGYNKEEDDWSKYAKDKISEKFGNQNKYRGSADWGGIPVWSISGDGYTGKFIGIDDNNDVFVLKRKLVGEDMDEYEDEQIHLVNEDDARGLNKLLSKLK